MGVPHAPRTRTDGDRRRLRVSVVLAVVTGVLVGTGFMAVWLDRTLSDSDVLARRATLALESRAVRNAIAVELTDELARAGVRSILAVRPAAIAAIEAVIQTETFRSIFAAAVGGTHRAMVSGGDPVGLDLSESLSLIADGLRLRELESAEASGDVATGTFPGLIDDISGLAVWELVSTINTAARVLPPLALAAAVGAVAVAPDRRRAVRRLGFAVAVAGLAVLAVVASAAWLAARSADSRALQDAFGDLVWKVTVDLRAVARAAVLVGVVTVAATSAPGRSLAELGDRARARWGGLRTSPGGTALIAAGLFVAGVGTIVNPAGAARLGVVTGGLVAVFVAVRLGIEVLDRRGVPAAAGEGTAVASGDGRSWWPLGLAGALVAVVGYSVWSTSAALADAEPDLERTCLGSVELCRLRLDEVVLPGTHNSMSAAQYPGFLFAEQTEPIGRQLRSGVRALLIDTHYGVPSSATMPGARVPVIVTDVARARTVPGAEVSDALRAEAERLAADAPPAAGARRDIYLCHNYCEFGAVRLLDELRTIRQFLDRNPGEIVVLVVQDATSSADTARVFEQAGLVELAAVLEPGTELPTLGELVDAGTPLVVFAERGDPDAPPWYHRAFDWFQETPFRFPSVDGFDCGPNRGDPDNPLLLVNHWITRSPPDPGVARRANAEAALRARFDQCLAERGMRPNVIAVDFAALGDLIPFTRDRNAEALAR